MEDFAAIGGVGGGSGHGRAGVRGGGDAGGGRPCEQGAAGGQQRGDFESECWRRVDGAAAVRSGGAAGGNDLGAGLASGATAVLQSGGYVGTGERADAGRGVGGVQRHVRYAAVAWERHAGVFGEPGGDVCDGGRDVDCEGVDDDSGDELWAGSDGGGRGGGG